MNRWCRDRTNSEQTRKIDKRMAQNCHKYRTAKVEKVVFFKGLARNQYMQSTHHRFASELLHEDGDWAFWEKCLLFAGSFPRDSSGWFWRCWADSLLSFRNSRAV